MKKLIITIISLILLLGIGFVYLVKNPELPIAQKVLTLVGMDTTNNNQNTRPNRASVGMNNPASRNCERKGGTSEIVEGTGGQVGMCVFSDGTSCEERAYMRGQCGIEQRRGPGAATSSNKIDSGTACTMEYTPVCGSVQVQCDKEPCAPIEQTFGNRCMMEANSGAKFLYEGVCTNK